MTKKRTGLIITAVALVVLVIVGYFAFGGQSGSFAEMELSELEAIANEKIDGLVKTGVLTTDYIAKNANISVDSAEYGEQKDVTLYARLETIDVYSAVAPHYAEFMSAEAKKKNGMQKSALDFRMEFEEGFLELLEDAEKVTYDIELSLYKTADGIEAYIPYELANKIYGNALDISKDVKDAKIYISEDGTEKKISSTNIPKGIIESFDVLYNEEIPDTSTFLGRYINKFTDDFEKNFIDHQRWKTILNGLWVTIKLTVLALLIGIVLGFIVAFIRCTYLKASRPNGILKFINGVCQVYLTVIRGTPVVVQIMIIYFVIFMPVGVDKFIAAVICFGLNSGAYVAEIVRGGIMSIDAGQTEAGRSLGFNYMQTMGYIVFPQAFKAVLPALANEFVVLLKETSIAFYIGIGDLMYSGNAIRAATYSAFMPLVAVAIIYLIMVIGLSKLVSLLERRLRNSER